MEEIMSNNEYTKELQKIISYMQEILVNEFPTTKFTPEYLILSILDNNNSHAYMLLDNCLMSDNLGQLRDIYLNFLRSQEQVVSKPDNIEYDESLQKILENAANECKKLSSHLIGSEHVLLSMLSEETNNTKIQEVFKNVGIEYNFIRNKSSERNKPRNPLRMNNPMKPNLILPLKSEINQKAITSKTNYINQYTINITQQAREGKIDDLIGRENEIRQIVRTMARRKKNNVILVGKGGVGKCLGKGTKVLMYDGTFKKVEDIEIGDKLMGIDSTPRNVLGLGHGFDTMYKVHQSHGMDYVTNSEHILSLKGGNHSVYKKGKIYDVPIQDFIKLCPTRQKNLFGFKSGLINFNKKGELPLDPYFLGLWLGDGTSSKPEITNIDDEIIDYVYDYAELNECTVTKHDIRYNIRSKYNGQIIHLFNETNDTYDTISNISEKYGISKACLQSTLNGFQKKTHGFNVEFYKDGKNKIRENLKVLNLLNNKHIPHCYLTASIEDRLKLFAGIIDTDGYKIKNYGYGICLVNKTLYDDILFLANSLGLNTRINANKIIKGKEYYRASFYGKMLEQVPVLLERKKLTNISPNKDNLLSRITIEEIGQGEYFGFEIDGDKRFILEDFTVTHNTAIVNGLAKIIAANNVPEFLLNKEILKLNVMALVSGTHFRGMFEERVNGLFEELKAGKNYILFIDDMQTVLKTGTKDKDTDLSSMINDILSENDVQVIGAINFKDYKNAIESNASLSRRFQKIIIDPSTVEETIEILKASRNYYEEFHHVTYSDKVIKNCVALANRYITERSLPDTAFDVMDLTGANSCFRQRDPEDIIFAKNRLLNIDKERANYLNEGDFEYADKLTQEENALKLMISNYNRERNDTKIEITENDVATIVSVMTKIPVNKLSANEKTKIAHIEDILKESVIGQDEAIDSVCRIIKRNKVGLNNKGKTLGNLLLAGNSGVGKTLIAKKLAEEIFGDTNALIRIDMSEYSEKNSVAKLTGAAPGYVGYENGGQLTEAIKNKQHCVLLLDEIEKADQEIYNLFLQLFDEGRLTDSSGQIVNFKNVIVLMTSNIGAKKAAEFGGGIGFDDDIEGNKKSIIEKEIKKKFTPEFLNRIDQIVYFNPLTDDNLYNIVKLELNNFKKKIVEIEYDAEWTEDVVRYLADKAIAQKEYGARPILRLIQTLIEDEITNLILINDYDKNYTFKITCENGELNIR